MNHGNVTAIVVPGSARTLPTGINDQGQIAGTYVFGALGFLLDPDLFGNFILGGEHGFVLDKGVFRTIDVPGANGTSVSGINNRGDLVGNYAKGTSVGAAPHAFVMIR